MLVLQVLGMTGVAFMKYIQAGFCCPDIVDKICSLQLCAGSTVFSILSSPELFVRVPGHSLIVPGHSLIVVVYVGTFIIAEYIQLAPMNVHFDVCPLFNGMFFKIFVGFSSVLK